MQILDKEMYQLGMSIEPNFVFHMYSQLKTRVRKELCEGIIIYREKVKMLLFAHGIVIIVNKLHEFKEIIKMFKNI